MGTIILTFILIIIGLALSPTVGNQVAAAVASPNITGVASTLLGLVPMFWAIFVISIGVVAVYKQFQGLG